MYTISFAYNVTHELAMQEYETILSYLSCHKSVKLNQKTPF